MISVIVPCYNQATYLSETLESVYLQTHKDWECIIINDGSTDATLEVAQRWLDKDPRFKYIYQKNEGLGGARNTGLRAAKGDYIQLLDADDLIKKEKFNTQLQHLEDSDISVCDYFPFVDGNLDEVAQFRYLSPLLSLTNYKCEIIQDWEYRKSIPCHSVLFKRSLLVKHDIKFDIKLPNHEDWHFWSRVFYVSSSLSNVNQVLALYRIRSNSMSSDYRLMKQGFLKAADELKIFFKDKNEENFVQLIKQKKKEIIHKNRSPIQRTLKHQIKSKLYYIYRYAFNKH